MKNEWIKTERVDALVVVIVIGAHVAPGGVLLFIRTFIVSTQWIVTMSNF
jgi:hypothetical protein